MFKAIQYISSPAGYKLRLELQESQLICLFSLSLFLSLSLSLSLPSLYPLFSRFLRGWCKCLRQSKKEAAQRGIGLALSSISPNSSASSLFLSFSLSLSHSLSLSLFLPSFFRFLRVQLFKAIQYISSPADTSFALSSKSPNLSAFSLFLSFSLSLFLSLSLYSLFSCFLRGWRKCLRQSNIEAAQRGIGLALSSKGPNSSASSLFLSLSISLFLLYTLFVPAFFRVGANV